MIHGLAVQLDGALRLSSTVGKGTTATLMLPVRDRGAGSRERRACRRAKVKPLRGDPGRRRRSADRDVDHGHAGRSRPRGDRRQFRPARARDPRSEQPIDLMITDHVMPGMTGVELAAAARSAPVAADPARDRLRRSARGRAARSAAAGETLSPGPVARPARSAAGVKLPVIPRSRAARGVSKGALHVPGPSRRRRRCVRLLRTAEECRTRAGYDAVTPPSARVRPRSPLSALSCRPCRRRSSAAR